MEKNLISDAMLIVIAGSGPTAPALTVTLYHLAQRPDVVERLHKELRSVNFAVEETTHCHLANVKFLDTVLNKALRLHPPIWSGPKRMTPPEGLQMGDTYVPGIIRIQTLLYSLHRGMSPNSCWRACCLEFSSVKTEQARMVCLAALSFRKFPTDIMINGLNWERISKVILTSTRSCLLCATWHV